MRTLRAWSILGVALTALTAGFPATVHGEAPVAPIAVGAHGRLASPDLVLLAWAPTVEMEADATYRIHRASDGGPFALVGETRATTFVDGAAVDLGAATYAITRVDGDGVESPLDLLTLNTGNGECLRVSRLTVAVYLRDCIKMEHPG